MNFARTTLRAQKVTIPEPKVYDYMTPNVLNKQYIYNYCFAKINQLKQGRTSYYIGITDDPHERLKSHHANKEKQYTEMYLLTKKLEPVTVNVIEKALITTFIDEDYNENKKIFANATVDSYIYFATK